VHGTIKKTKYVHVMAVQLSVQFVCFRWPIASLWYICIFVVLNASKYVIIIEVTKKSTFEESQQQ